MTNAIVKKVSEKGYGFLIVQGRPKDLFFHFSKMRFPEDFDKLKEGQDVTFDEIMSTKSGDVAIGVTAVE
jgi:cold shock CspA family protein